MSKMTKKHVFLPIVVEDDVLESRCEIRKVAEWNAKYIKCSIPGFIKLIIDIILVSKYLLKASVGHKKIDMALPDLKILYSKNQILV
jgi:hypothetical protein